MEFELARDHKKSSPLTLLLDFVSFHLAINSNTLIQLSQGSVELRVQLWATPFKKYCISWSRSKEKSKNKDLKIHDLLGKTEKLGLFKVGKTEGRCDNSLQIHKMLLQKNVTNQLFWQREEN